MENLFNNLELVKSMIIFFILMTLVCDSGGDIVRGKKILVTLAGQRLKGRQPLRLVHNSEN